MKPLMNIKDGRLPTVANMRRVFEASVAGTPMLARRADLTERPLKDGKFDGYADETVDWLWVGWALGMRCSQRLLDADLTGVYLDGLVERLKPEARLAGGAQKL